VIAVQACDDDDVDVDDDDDVDDVDDVGGADVVVVVMMHSAKQVSRHGTCGYHQIVRRVRPTDADAPAHRRLCVCVCVCVLGSEWMEHQHRDSYASYLGHTNVLSLFAIAENESVARVRFDFLKVRSRCMPAIGVVSLSHVVAARARRKWCCRVARRLPSPSISSERHHRRCQRRARVCK
jgi:hypothetical protein